MDSPSKAVDVSEVGGKAVRRLRTGRRIPRKIVGAFVHVNVTSGNDPTRDFDFANVAFDLNELDRFGTAPHVEGVPERNPEVPVRAFDRCLAPFGKAPDNVRSVDNYPKERGPRNLEQKYNGV